ncbi:hypothetical protein ABTI24_19060, partial [Acinetobacter baumannii]
VHVSVETPSKLSNEEKELLEQLAKLRGESLTISDEDRKAEYEREAEKREKESQSKADKKAAKAKSKQKDEPVKEDSSIIDK